MNICFVSDYYSDYVGGGEQSLANQMAALAAAGHQIYLIRPHQDHQAVQPHELVLKPSFVFRISTAAMPITPNTVARRRRIRTFLLENHIDIIHSQGQGGPSYTTLVVARKLGIPFVDTVHTFFWKVQESFGTRALEPVSPLVLSSFTGYMVTPLPKSFGGNFGERTLRGCTLTFTKKVDLVVSPSEHQRDALVEAALTTPVVCIPNPISHRFQTEVQPLPPVEPLRLVWIARMNPEKRLLALAEALRLVHEQRPGKVEMTIIGEGTDQAEAQQLTHDLPNVRYTGILGQAEIMEQIDQSHALVLTSYHFDNQPMVVAEAISRHRGIIYCDERLTPEILGAGILTKSPSAAAIAQTIISCIDDPDQLAVASERCRKQAAIFSPEQFARAMTSVYRSLLDS